jgi:hypothetical protein
VHPPHSVCSTVVPHSTDSLPVFPTMAPGRQWGRHSRGPPPSYATRDAARMGLGLSVVGGANLGDSETLESGPSHPPPRPGGSGSA